MMLILHGPQQGGHGTMQPENKCLDMNLDFTVVVWLCLVTSWALIVDLPETDTHSWSQAQNHTQLSFETAKKKN